MDTLQWPEGIRNVNSTVEDNLAPTNEEQVTANSKALGTRPQQAKPKALNCPRCNSTHTKFCYYNNYSLSQPRYFCKTCRRYWTAGGSLRNVPVGGGPRKHKRYSSSLSKIKLLPQTSINSQNPNYIQDLNLAFSPFCPSNISSSVFNQFVEFPSTTTSSHHHSHISELYKSGIGGRGFNSFMSMINPISDSNNSGLAFQEFGKPDRLHFRPDQNNNSDEAKLFFPFEDLKQAAEPQLINSSMSRNDHELVDQHSRLNEPDHHQTAAGFGDGLAGSSGGGSWYLNMHEEN